MENLRWLYVPQVRCVMSEIQILIDYHREQVEEAIACREYDAVRLHDYLLGIARRVKAELEEISA